MSLLKFLVEFLIAFYFIITIIYFFLVGMRIYLHIKERWDWLGNVEPREGNVGMKLNVIQFILWMAYLGIGIINHSLIDCILGGIGIAICTYDFVLERKIKNK